MKKGILVIMILFVIASILYVYNGDTCIYEIQTTHYIELFMITLLGIFLPRIIKHSTWSKTISLTIYLLAIAQLCHTFYTYFWSFDIDHRFLASPIGKIGTIVVRGTICGAYLWFAHKALQGILQIIYKLFNPIVKRTKSTKDDQILIYIYNVTSFLTPLLLFFVWCMFGLQISWHIAGVSTILLAAVGFAFRGIFHDYLSGMLINIEDLVRVNDIITVDNKKGRVDEIHARYITLKTLSGSTKYIPNGMMTSTSFTNHTKENYLGIFETFTIPVTTSKKGRELEKKLRTFIYNFNPVADVEIGQKEPRIVVKFERLENEKMLYRYEFMIRLKNFDPNKQSISERYFHVDKTKHEIKQAINYKIVDLLHELNIIIKPLKFIQNEGLF